VLDADADADSDSDSEAEADSDEGSTIPADYLGAAQRTDTTTRVITTSALGPMTTQRHDQSDLAL
jgi:hypothetical protein